MGWQISAPLGSPGVTIESQISITFNHASALDTDGGIYLSISRERLVILVRLVELEKS